MSEVETGALGRGPDRAARARAGDALELPRLRDVRDRVARAARRARRAQAGAPARPVRDARGRPAAEPAVQEVRLHGRRRDGELPPARRPGDLRHARPDGAAVLAALPARRRAGQLRLDRRRSRGRDALHGSAALADRDRAPARHRREHGRLRAELRRVAPAAVRPAFALPEPSRQRLHGDRGRDGDEHAAAPPRRDDRRGRRDDRRPRDQRRGPDEARQGPGLPDRRDHRRAAAASATRIAPAAAASSCAPAPTSRSCAAARRPSS